MTLPKIGKVAINVWYDSNMATETQHLESIGHICATLQKPYGVVRRARPTWEWNRPWS